MRKNKWIPIKEGNPKKTGSYLVTLRTKLNNPSSVTWFYTYRKNKRYWTDTDSLHKDLASDSVIAWKQMPKPCKNKPGKANGWNPMSEKPETGWYNVTLKMGDGLSARKTGVLCYRAPEGYWTESDISVKSAVSDSVIAWAPMPRPYKEDKKDE